MTTLTYRLLSDHFREIQQLASIQAVLEWDQQTGMPPRAGDYRAQQIAYLAAQIHDHRTDPRIADWLSELEDHSQQGSLSDRELANVRQLRREYDRNLRLPTSLVREMATMTAKAQMVWVEAHQNEDYSLFQPLLARIVELKRAEADAIGFVDCRYDALLDEYEPGCRTADVQRVLTELKQDLVPLIQQLIHSGRQPSTSCLRGEFPTASQNRFCRRVAKKIGFDFARGRLDVAHHPFCTELGPHDTRLTTRYDPNFFNTALFGVLHETGHGLYEQGLVDEEYGLPGGSYCSLGIHESQSRLWENNVGRSREFWAHFFPQAQQAFACLANVSQEEFYRAINQVQPSLIRVEADEATYNLHIIIRFELEQELLEGRLSVESLPEAWNQKYQETLEIAPPSDRQGCLQDIHWSAGLMGYFPTYCLGNLYACQLFDAAEAELGDFNRNFSLGNFDVLLNWLRERVHEQGRLMNAADLIKLVTGSSIQHRPLIKYLQGKLIPIYGL